MVFLLSRKQGNGREITQSRRGQQGDIVRKETIRAHREAPEIAAGWGDVAVELSFGGGGVREGEEEIKGGLTTN